MGGPLTELRNQRQPRRKMPQTYGKKTQGNASAHRELFGSDENQIDSALSKLNLEEPGVVTAPPNPVKEMIFIPQNSDDTIGRTPIELPKDLVSEEDAVVIAPLMSVAESNVELFSTFSTKLLKSFNLEKIGEGSFAEVFKLTPKPAISSSASTTTPLPTGGAIIKIIPLKIPSSGDAPRDRLSSVDSVLREIRVFRTLDSIHGFTRFRGVRLITGFWPAQFLGAFRKFRREHKKRAFNYSPEDDFEEKQIYAVVEMNDAGMEISVLQKPTVFTVYDIFWMTTILLANAEEKIEFEHRDLHSSNLCVKSSITETKDEDSDDGSDISRSAQPDLDIDRTILKDMTDENVPSTKLGLSNLTITIIDYTLVRCNLAPLPEATQSKPEIAYDSMAFISDLPVGAKNKETNIQYQTYRKTRASVQHAKLSSGSSGDKWMQFVPRTNVCWLAYLLKTLSWRSKGRALKYYVVRGSSKAAKALQEEMWDTLAKVEEVVSGDDLEGSGSDDGDLAVEEEFSSEELERTPASAAALLARAVEEGWLSRGEVEAFKERLELES